MFFDILIQKLKRDLENEVVDTESLKKLQNQAIKNDKKFGKKFDDALHQRQEHRRKWIGQQKSRLVKNEKLIEADKKAYAQAKEDFEVVQKKLDEFESENIDESGNYKSGLEEC